MARRKTPNIPVFSIGSEQEFYRICRKMITESGMTFTQSSVRRFYRICREMNVVEHPWMPTLYVPQIIGLNSAEASHHNNLVFLWRRVAFKLFCDWLTKETGKLVDVLGSFQSETYVRYYESLSMDECEVLNVAHSSRQHHILSEEFGIRNLEYSWPTLEAQLRKLEKPRQQLKFLKGILWWEQWHNRRKIMPDGFRPQVDQMWEEFEIRGEIGYYPPKDGRVFLFNHIPENEKFQPLRDFLNDFSTRFGKIVWTLPVKDLARLIDRLFNDGPNHKLLIKPLQNRFDRATDWFTKPNDSLSFHSLTQLASQMNNPTSGISPSANIETLCDAIQAASQSPDDFSQ